MAFDVNQFLNTSIEAAHEVDFTNVPDGEYRVNIDGIDAKAGKSEGDQNSVMLTLKLKFHDAAIAELMNRDPYIWNYIVFVECDQNYQVLYGKNQNIELGRVRAATNTNNPNKKFSFSMLENTPDLIIKVQNKKDKNDKERANIVAWAAA